MRVRPAAAAALAGFVLAASIGASPAENRAAGSATASGAAAPERVVIGRSVEGRAITALRLGDPDAERVGLVVGAIHGDERAGLRVAAALRRGYRGLAGAQLWVMDTLNPDGARTGSRKNARAVDLNRNFPFRWRGGVHPSNGYYPGRRAASEPETRTAIRLIRRIQPDVSVWYHQPWGVVLACRGRPAAGAIYARLVRMPASCRARGLRGTAAGWQRNRLRAGTAFVVELPAAGITRRAARRHAAAAMAVIRGARPARAGESAAVRAAVRPAIRKRLIPYPRSRKRDMAAYSKRHYGRFRWELRRPKLIVQHYAVAGSVGAIWRTFAPNRPDPEYNELPGVCSHYAVAANGRVFRLVPDRIRCRHVVGLNHVAIGIEHVGFSDGEVLGRKRQLRASARLTQWLRCRHGIPVKGVIGHAESLGSPFYKELDPDFRGRTHGDFRTGAMRIYRGAVRRLGPC